MFCTDACRESYCVMKIHKNTIHRILRYWNHQGYSLHKHFSYQLRITLQLNVLSLPNIKVTLKTYAFCNKTFSTFTWFNSHTLEWNKSVMQSKWKWRKFAIDVTHVAIMNLMFHLMKTKTNSIRMKTNNYHNIMCEYVLWIEFQMIHIKGRLY